MVQKRIDLVGNEVVRVAYGAFNGQRIAVHDKGAEPATPPGGTVYVQEATLLEGVTTGNDKQIPGLTDLVLEIGSKQFLRGRLVADKKEAEQLLIPPFVRSLVGGLKEVMGVEVETMLEGAPPLVVAITMADGTEVGIPLSDGDIAPPDGASLYPVGASPEEAAEAEARAMAEEDLDDEVPELTDEEKTAGYVIGTCPGCGEVHALSPRLQAIVAQQAEEDSLPIAELVEEDLAS